MPKKAKKLEQPVQPEPPPARDNYRPPDIDPGEGQSMVTIRLWKSSHLELLRRALRAGMSMNMYLLAQLDLPPTANPSETPRGRLPSFLPDAEVERLRAEGLEARKRRFESLSDHQKVAWLMGYETLRVEGEGDGEEGTDGGTFRLLYRYIGRDAISRPLQSETAIAACKEAAEFIGCTPEEIDFVWI